MHCDSNCRAWVRTNLTCLRSRRLHTFGSQQKVPLVAAVYKQFFREMAEPLIP